MKKSFKIIAVFPLKNLIELICIETNEISYFKYAPTKSVKAQAMIGKYFALPEEVENE